MDVSENREAAGPNHRGATSAVVAVSADQYVCPFLFDFLTITEVGRAAAVCKAWQAGAGDDELWRELYARTQVGETNMDQWVRALAARPFGEDAEGWEVEVYVEEDDVWRQGLVLDYADGLYRVEYADGSWQWESERRTQGPWHQRGNSRLYFVGRLHDSIAGTGGDPSAPAAAASASSSSNSRDTSPEAEAGAGTGGAANTSTLRTAKAGVSRSPASPEPPISQRHERWKEELKANVCHVPSVQLARLTDHTDEVLDIKFSPDGKYLATCSRDMSILVYSVEGDQGTGGDSGHAADGSWRNRGSSSEEGGGIGAQADGESARAFHVVGEHAGESRRRLGYRGLSTRLLHRLRRSATASVCRIFWSPCSRFILSCLEEPHGIQYNPSSTELWDAMRGEWLSRCCSQPFDVHAAWLPSGHHFIGGLDIDWDESNLAAPFSQTLAIRRRPNLSPNTRLDVLASLARPNGGGGGVAAEGGGKLGVASAAGLSGAAPAGAASAHSGSGGSSGGWVAVQKSAQDARDANAGSTELLEGVGWRKAESEEPYTPAMVLSPAKASVTALSDYDDVVDMEEGDDEEEGEPEEAEGVMWVDPVAETRDAAEHVLEIPGKSGSSGGGGGRGGRGEPGRGEDESSLVGGGGGAMPFTFGDVVPSGHVVVPDAAALGAGEGTHHQPGHHHHRQRQFRDADEAHQPGFDTDDDAEMAAVQDPWMTPDGDEDVHGIAAGGGAGGAMSVAAATHGSFQGGGGGLGSGAGGVGGDDEGGVQWVAAGHETLHAADEAEMPLVGEIRLNLGRNFGHFLQISSSGEWACITTGDIPLNHRISFIPLRGPGVTPYRSRREAPTAADSSGGATRSAEIAAASLRAQHQSQHQSQPGVSVQDAEASPAPAWDDYDVYIRALGGNCCSSPGDSGAGVQPGVQELSVSRMETVECGGAVLSLSISRDNRFVLANVRPFPKGALERLRESDEPFVAPDISNDIELQVWDVETKELLFKLGGHHAFTTKDCPFLIFAEQSSADPFGDYVCSGSEEHRVYVWHLRHRFLLAALQGHRNVVNSVSWNARHPGVMASCSDDGTVIIWGPKCRR